ncbi:MAG: Lrp/AsnC ligand binding domain-containing protein [Prevotellaceae bacterium]|jgi:Lrp/AsnC family transcriptional regulator for asnA, asnC and gidA|nr:Lrp/AsnC ligand binding domain-containing protein [Prevotellaceae bacterium]
MSTRYKIDPLDQKILSFLIKNARMAYLEIARECGISGAAVHQRVKKMEDAGIITGARLLVKPPALGFDVCAFVGVHLLQSGLYPGTVEAIQKIPEVVECHFVTGDYALLLKLFCRDHEHLMDVLLNTILNLPNVSKTETIISLDQIFERQVWVKDKRTPKAKSAAGAAPAQKKAGRKAKAAGK